MATNQRTRLIGTIVKLYRTHWRLFWCIMLPIAIVAISLHIVQFFYIVTQSEEYVGNTPSRQVYTVTFTSNVNTWAGIEPEPTVADTSTNLSTNTSTAPRVSWAPYPIPRFSSTNSEGVTWKWEPKFRSLDYTPLILLLLTLCPLSLAVARISRSSQASNISADSMPLTAREMWRQTGRKAFTFFVAALCFVLIMDVGSYLYALMSWLMPSVVRGLPFEFEFMLFLQIVPHIYFLVMLSLYNPCLILENNSIIGIFRRSHALVSEARLRFLGIYLLTGWVASVITSVLLGVALLVFSLFIPDLAQIRGVLSPLKFLTLFIGADVRVVLPELLSVPATVAILIVRGLIATFLVPIWAILTTHLYLERTGDLQISP